MTAAAPTTGAQRVCEQANKGTFVDLDGLAYVCLGPQNARGAQRQCERTHRGAFIDADGLAYVCLGPSSGSALAVRL
jgi:hypothetical protein